MNDDTDPWNTLQHFILLVHVCLCFADIQWVSTTPQWDSTTTPTYSLLTFLLGIGGGIVFGFLAAFFVVVIILLARKKVRFTKPKIKEQARPTQNEAYEDATIAECTLTDSRAYELPPGAEQPQPQYMTVLP